MRRDREQERESVCEEGGLFWGIVKQKFDNVDDRHKNRIEIDAKRNREICRKKHRSIYTLMLAVCQILKNNRKIYGQTD